MADVKWELDSDIKKVEANNAKLIRDNAKLKDSLRQVKEESTRAGDTMKQKADAVTRSLQATRVQTGSVQHGFGLIASGVTGIIAPLLTVQAAISTARQFTAEWVKDTEKLLALRRDLQKETLGAAIPAGVSGPDIERFLQRETPATSKQMLAAFAGLTEAAPTLDRQRQFDVAEQIARQGVRGADVRGLGGVAGEIASRIQRDPGDIADLTVKVQSLLGEKAKMVGSDAWQRGMASLIRDKGMSAEDALATAVVGLQADQKGNILDRFAKGGKEAKAALKVLPQAEIENVRKQLDAAMRDDFAEQQLVNLQTFGAGREALAQQRLERIRDKAAGAPLVIEQQQLARTREEIRTRAYGTWRYPAALAHTAVTGFQEYLPQFMQIENKTTAEPVSKSLQFAGQIGAITPEGRKEIEVQERMITQLDRLNKTMQQVNRQRGVNVDAHQE